METEFYNISPIADAVGLIIVLIFAAVVAIGFMYEIKFNHDAQK